MEHNKISAETLKELSKKIGQKNKHRNRIIAIAIILTTMLITIVFTTAFSLQSFLQQQSLKEIGTYAEACYKTITLDEYEVLLKNGLFDDISYTIYIGNGSADVFSNHVVEFRYTDEKAAKWNFCELESGHFPQDRNEIVIDNLFMNYVGKDYQIGDLASVEIEINKQIRTYEFVVSGIYNGNNVTGVSMVYVSYAFAEEVLDNAGSIDDTDCGSVDVFCRLDGIDGAYEYLLDGWRKSGLSGVPAIGVNWVLENQSLGVTGIALVGVVVLIIMIAGYLMIYNIFYISIVNDMQFYGRLKLIGMQNWQIRRLLGYEVVRLCMSSIPVGLLLGWAIGTKSLPVFLKLMSISASNVQTFYPLVFVYSLFFVLFTVYISMRKPLKLLKEIQPIETVKYLGGMNLRKGIHAKESFSIATFAYRNINRNRKKSILLIASLTLVMTLFVISANLVNSVNFEKFFENAIPNDIYIGSSKFLQDGEVEALSNDFVDSCCSLQGVNSSSRYYMRTTLHFLSAEAMQELESAYERNVFESDEISDFIEILLFRPSAVGTEIRYYFEEQEVSKLDVLEGEIDYNKLQQGDYVIVCNRIGETDGTSIYHAGDKITLYDWNENSGVTKLSDGSIEYHDLGEEEYIVMAVVEAKDSIMNYNNGYILNSIMPAEKAKEDNSALLYSVGLDVDNIPETTLRIDELSKSNGIDVEYITMYEKKQEYSNLRLVFVMMAGGITMIIAIMSIINFLNQCITGVIERKKELRTLHSIGMTDKQIVTMLELENGYLLLFSIIVGYIIGTFVSAALFRNLQPYLKWLVYRNVIWPVVLLIVILGALIKCFTGKIYHTLKETF